MERLAEIRTDGRQITLIFALLMQELMRIWSGLAEAAELTWLQLQLDVVPH